MTRTAHRGRRGAANSSSSLACRPTASAESGRPLPAAAASPGRRRTASVCSVRSVWLDVHRQSNVAVAGERLRGLGRNSRLAQIGDEGVPIGVEVGEAAVVALVGEEVARFPFGLLLRSLGFLDPRLAGGGEVQLHHLRRFALDPRRHLDARHSPKKGAVRRV